MGEKTKSPSWKKRFGCGCLALFVIATISLLFFALGVVFRRPAEKSVQKLDGYRHQVKEDAKEIAGDAQQEIDRVKEDLNQKKQQINDRIDTGVQQLKNGIKQVRNGVDSTGDSVDDSVEEIRRKAPAVIEE